MLFLLDVSDTMKGGCFGLVKCVMVREERKKEGRREEGRGRETMVDVCRQRCRLAPVGCVSRLANTASLHSIVAYTYIYKVLLLHCPRRYALLTSPDVPLLAC